MNYNINTDRIVKLIFDSLLVCLLFFFTISPFSSSILEFFDVEYEMCALLEEDTNEEENIDDLVEDDVYVFGSISNANLLVLEKRQNYFQKQNGSSLFDLVIFLQPPIVIA